MEHRISALITATYEAEEMDRVVARHFAAFSFHDIVGPGMRVTVKPNLLMKRGPDAATTTHPQLVLSVIRHLQEMGVEDITIADSPGGPYTAAALEGIYRATGMADVAKATGAALNLDTGYQTVSCPVERGLCRDFHIINPIAQADLVVNLPKLKTHAMTTLSGGMKNLFGCVPGLQKPELHFRFPDKERFSRMLVELSQTVRPAFTIVDAVVSMEGDGPSSGNPRETGWTFASPSLAALDMALCEFIGLDVADVPMVAGAQVLGLCPRHPDEMVYLGDGKPPQEDGYRMPGTHQISFADSRRIPKPLRGAAKVVIDRYLTPRPQIHRQACIGCGKCAEICPADTITLLGKKARIYHKRCICCYCCHEMCPVKAIGIRRSRLLDL